jgi:hypothetical protein
VHFLQIWIIPERRGIAPGYEQRAFDAEEKAGKLRIVASRDGRDGSVTINRDADIYATLLDAGQSVTHELKAGRGARLQVARGSVVLNGERLDEGDGASAEAPGPLTLAGVGGAEVLLFDMKL